MEKALIWKLVRDAIPGGLFYNREAIPYKIDGYELVIDTKNINYDIFVEVNGDLISGKTDSNGVFRIIVPLLLGKNVIRYRFINEVGYKSFEIYTTNEALFSYGVVEGGSVVLDDIMNVLCDCFSETVVNLEKFKNLFDFDGILSGRDVRDIFVANMLWGGRVKSVKLLNSVSSGGISGYIDKLRTWVLNANVITNMEYFLDMAYGGSFTGFSTGVDLYGGYYRYNGRGGGRIYLRCGCLYDYRLFRKWVLSGWVRNNKGNVSIVIGIGYKDGREYSFDYLSNLEWGNFSWMLREEDYVPDYVFVEIPDLGGVYDFDFTGLNLVNAKWNRVAPFVVGSYLPVKTMGVCL